MQLQIYNQKTGIKRLYDAKHINNVASGLFLLNSLNILYPFYGSDFLYEGVELRNIGNPD